MDSIEDSLSMRQKVMILNIQTNTYIQRIVIKKSRNLANKRQFLIFIIHTLQRSENDSYTNNDYLLFMKGMQMSEIERGRYHITHVERGQCI